MARETPPDDPVAQAAKAGCKHRGRPCHCGDPCECGRTINGEPCRIPINQRAHAKYADKACKQYAYEQRQNSADRMTTAEADQAEDRFWEGVREIPRARITMGGRHRRRG